MKKNQVFKEIEARIIEEAGRPFISMDDLDKIISDIIFTKSGLDVHTLRTIKWLCSSIALTYKALKANEQLDINETLALVPLSKRKVKNIVKKGLKLSTKDKSLESDLEELEPYLAPEEPSLEISREETEELIQGSIHESLEPYIKLLAEIDRVVKQSASKPDKPDAVEQDEIQTVSKPEKKAPGKKKQKPKEKELVIEPDVPEDEDAEEIDFDALEEEMN